MVDLPGSLSLGGQLEYYTWHQEICKGNSRRHAWCLWRQWFHTCPLRYILISSRSTANWLHWTASQSIFKFWNLMVVGIAVKLNRIMIDSIAWQMHKALYWQVSIGWYIMNMSLKFYGMCQRFVTGQWLIGNHPGAGVYGIVSPRWAIFGRSCR